MVLFFSYSALLMIIGKSFVLFFYLHINYVTPPCFSASQDKAFAYKNYRQCVLKKNKAFAYRIYRHFTQQCIGFIFIYNSKNKSIYRLPSNHLDGFQILARTHFENCSCKEWGVKWGFRNSIYSKTTTYYQPAYIKLM